MKHLILLAAILLVFASISNAQTEDPPETDSTEVTFLDSIILQSPNRITVEAACAVRYAQNADIYLRWEAVQSATGYTVFYSLDGTEATWLSAQVSTNELLLEGLPLDTVLLWEVIPLGPDFEGDWQSGIAQVSSAAQLEPIAVSHKFYNSLEAWFAKENNYQGFCQFMDGMNGVSKYEKLAFLQTYAFDNASFVKPVSAPENLQAWFPPSTIYSNGEEQWCVPLIVGKCNCKVVTRGTNLATPNENMNDFKVKPKKFGKIISLAPDGTGEFEYRGEAGAAKFATLKQNRKSGSSTLVRSNLPISGDAQSVTTETSELAFFLACISNNGSYNTNLPTECDCSRPLHVYYEYTTKLRIKSKKRGCIWSKGSEATAEDWAFIGVFHGKTGDITPVASGRATLNSSCNSNWNPDFWIKLLDVANPVLKYYVQTLDTTSGNNIPSTTQIDQFISGLQTLIQTPFSIKNSNGCLDEEHDAPLVTGNKTYQLLPNNPIRVTLFSSYYLRTRGYGCWRSEAGVASDYYLLGVVESEAEPLNEECCANKYANYIVGSQSAPFNNTATFGLNAVNSIANRLGRVGFFLSIFGGWNGLPTVPGSGVIVLTREFDNGLLGPSCGDGEGERPAGGDRSQNNLTRDGIIFTAYPSAASDQLNVQINAEVDMDVDVRLFDIQGRLAKVLLKT